MADEATESTRLAGLLGEQGFAVHACPGPSEALRELEKTASGLFVSDRLLGGQSSLPLLETLRQRWPRVRRVLMTNEPGVMLVSQAINEGLIHRLLITPFDTVHLVSALREQVAQRRLAERTDELAALAARKGRELDLAQRLLRLQRLAAVGQLASGLAHELNNPLGTILAFAQILIREGTFNAEDLEALQYIEQGAVRCKRVIDAVVRFAHDTNAPDLREQVALADVAHEAFTLMHKQIENKSLVPTVAVDGPGPLVLGTFQHLQQLAQALLANAMEATEGRNAGGRVDLKVFTRGNQACLAVSDNGHGIEHSLRDRIFEPFFTTKIEGEAAGLGLTTADRIAQSHGGMIEVDSEPDRGSTFTLVLPLLPAGHLEAKP